MHNLCQTMQEFAEYHPDEFLELFHRYDYEEAAEYAEWEETPDGDPKKVREGLCFRKANEHYDEKDKKLHEDDGIEYDEEEYEYSDASDWADLCYEQNIDATEYPIEVLEFWAVSKWFGERLKEHDEVVEEVLDFNVWGRCTTGQAIAMDGVIVSIAAEMEILPGQRNDWSKND